MSENISQPLSPVPSSSNVASSADQQPQHAETVVNVKVKEPSKLHEVMHSREGKTSGDTHSKSADFSVMSQVSRSIAPEMERKL